MSAPLKEQVHQLSIARLSFIPGNRQGAVDVTELALTIMEQGLLQPILVRPHGAKGEYQVVCGERRTRAFMLNGKTEIPGIIRDLTDDEAAVANTVENMQREDLHFLEEATKVLKLLAALDINSVASLMGKSRQWVATRANLTKLSNEWTAAVLKPEDQEKYLWASAFNKWPIAHLEEVAKLGEDAQHKVFRYYQQRGHVPGMRDLMSVIGELTSLLSTAPFPLDYAGLKPGPCATCATRSNANVDLFGGAGSIEAEDRCLNLPCFKAKIEQWGREKLKEARQCADVGQKVIGVKAMEDPNFFKADGVIYKVSKKKDSPTVVVINGALAGQKVKVEVAQEKAASRQQPTQNSLDYQRAYYESHLDRERNKEIKLQGINFMGEQTNAFIGNMFTQLLNKNDDTELVYRTFDKLGNELVGNGDITDIELLSMLHIDFDAAMAKAKADNPYPAEWEGKEGPNVVKSWYEILNERRNVEVEDDEADDE